MDMQTKFDRTAEDVGNIVSLEHVNTRIDDQRLSTLFYVTGLGLTRDPYLVTSVVNMWINVGRSQFHLPTGKPQVLRGKVGLVLPDLAGLKRRLQSVGEMLDGTKFEFSAGNRAVDAVSPWGNRIRCHAPDQRFGSIALGMPYVELDVPEGAADGIARFYREIFHAPAAVKKSNGARAAHVSVGYRQQLIFRETKDKLPAYDGHHIQVYIADFSGPYAGLAEHGLITEESSQHQYRFEDIIDLDSGKKLFTLEHEVRSLSHPLYARPLVNRNPDQTNMEFAPGHETVSWALPYAG